MNEAREIEKLATVGQVVAIACTPDGRLVAVNDVDGRVWFYAADEPDEPLPLRFNLADASGVLLHPEGRVISYRSEQDELFVRVHDPRSARLLHEFAFDSSQQEELDELDEFDGELPSVEDDSHFEVAILQRPPPLEWLLPLEIANPRRDRDVQWMSTLPDEVRHLDMYPNRFTRMALHPNQRWLAVLDRSTWIIDLEAGELVNTLAYGIDMASLFEYGEGTHTIGFDERGLLTVASVAISGNPFLQVDRIEVESGDQESITENWRQGWDPPAIEVHVYDPTTHLPPERIPEGTYKVLFRPRAIELWSRAGLLRGVSVGARTCVIPSFDPGSFCAEPRALLVTDESLELLDLVTGERSPRRPPLGEPLQTSALDHIGFDPARRRVLLWRDHVALLAAPIGEDRWGVCELPEGRRVRDWAFASESGRAFVVDEDGDLWVGRLDPEPGSSLRPRPSLEPLERELLAHPHDAAPFLVYADALSERGDVRGELILLQHHGALDDARTLIERNREALLGPIDGLAPTSFELRWERGYVRSAKFDITYDALGSVLAFLASEPARLIESLELQLAPRSNVDDVSAIYGQIDAYLTAARHLPLLCTLKLGANNLR